LAEILFGDTNPSGHLPATFERRWEDNPTHDNYYPEKGSNRIPYKEGVFVGYRGYERNHVKPLFPFGYGLSYTTFKYDNLSVKPISTEEKSALQYEISFDVTNTGNRAGAAVAQVYVAEKHTSMPRPAKELKGFARLSLAPGEKRRTTVPLDTRSFSFYDVNAKHWRAEPGSYSVLVGGSSEQIELIRDLEIAGAVSSE
jgi:beta-glucosidase